MLVKSKPLLAALPSLLTVDPVPPRDAPPRDALAPPAADRAPTPAEANEAVAALLELMLLPAARTAARKAASRRRRLRDGDVPVTHRCSWGRGELRM